MKNISDTPIENCGRHTDPLEPLWEPCVACELQDARDRLYKDADELGYVIEPKVDVKKRMLKDALASDHVVLSDDQWEVVHELVLDRLKLIEERPDGERDHEEEETLNELYYYHSLNYEKFRDGSET
tara:strand:+ start:334 stop:714 length:381 start_codon:yes stop_codon:yes gene_type:complete